MTKKGFTLIELLVVIMIIIIVASVTVGLFNVWFRGQGVRQGAIVSMQALSRAKGLAADKRIMYFVVFSNLADGGQIKIYQDTGNPPNRVYDPGTDLEIEMRPFLLPRGVRFVPTKCPYYIGVGPSGYCEFSSTSVAGGSFVEVQASNFEFDISSNTVTGDIVVEQTGSSKYKMCLDVDKASGKIRRSHFLVQ